MTKDTHKSRNMTQITWIGRAQLNIVPSIAAHWSLATSTATHLCDCHLQSSAASQNSPPSPVILLFLFLHKHRNHNSNHNHNYDHDHGHLLYAAFFFTYLPPLRSIALPLTPSHAVSQRSLFLTPGQNAPHCHHFNKWEHSHVQGAQCCAPDCDRTIGKGIVFLLQCEKCKMRACQRHQRKATTHSTQHQWGMTKEHNRKTFL